jgi:hypothetical protein
MRVSEGRFIDKEIELYAKIITVNVIVPEEANGNGTKFYFVPFYSKMI